MDVNSTSHSSILKVLAAFKAASQGFFARVCMRSKIRIPKMFYLYKTANNARPGNWSFEVCPLHASNAGKPLSEK